MSCENECCLSNVVLLTNLTLIISGSLFFSLVDSSNSQTVCRDRFSGEPRQSNNFSIVPQPKAQNVWELLVYSNERTRTVVNLYTLIEFLLTTNHQSFCRIYHEHINTICATGGRQEASLHSKVISSNYPIPLVLGN